MIVAGADEQVLRLLHDEHARALWGYAMRLTGGDAGRSEDAVQETLLRAWKHPEALDAQRGSPRAWLFTTLRNVLIDEWRARSVRPEVVTDDLPERAGPDHADTAVQSWLIAEALRQLSQQHREVLLECYYRGCSVAQAAARLGVPQRHGQVPDLLRVAGSQARPRGERGDGMTDRFTHDAAPYVLGALAPEERRAFEEHLAGCEGCMAEVRDFAGLPGLLSRLPAEEVLSEPEDQPEPPSLLAPLLVRVGSERRARRWRAVLVGAAAACLAAVGSAVVVDTVDATAGAAAGRRAGLRPRRRRTSPPPRRPR